MQDNSSTIPQYLDSINIPTDPVEAIQTINKLRGNTPKTTEALNLLGANQPMKVNPLYG